MINGDEIMFVYVVMKRMTYENVLLNIFTNKEDAIDFASKYKINDITDGIFILKIETDLDECYPFKNIIYRKGV